MPLGAVDEARTWLARELHDGAVQRLTVLVVEVEQLRRRSAPDPGLDRIYESARGAIADLRGVITGLRDDPSTETNFVGSVRRLLDEFISLSGIAGDLIIGPVPDELPTILATNLRRVLGEALSNVRRHSGAHHVAITVEMLETSLEMIVRDDGHGLEFTEDGTGIRGMRERVRLLGGELAVEGATGGGTIVRCAIPLGDSR
jgi:two-component system sensor histidine kinase UhpB